MRIATIVILGSEIVVKTDMLLIQRAKNGELAAFTELVSKYEKRIFNYAYRLTGQYEDAKDLVQEALLKAYRALAGFRGEASFLTWLSRIVANTYFDELRKQRTKQQEIISLDEPLTGDNSCFLRQIKAVNPTPEEAMEKLEVQVRVQQALDCLAPDHRNIIVLRDLQCFSYQEIAEILHCSIGTVKSRLSRGRDRLRGELINHYPDLVQDYNAVERHHSKHIAI